MLDSKLTAAQRSKQVDLLVEEQVVLLAPEPVVRLLLDDNDNVSWSDSWCLVALSPERDRLAPPHTLVDVDFEHLFLGDNFAAVAHFAPIFVVDDFPSAVALVARLLDLLDHRTHLAERDPDTAAAARRALSHSALFATLTAALGANDVPGEGKLGGLALVEVLEGDVHAMDKVFRLPRTRRA